MDRGGFGRGGRHSWRDIVRGGASGSGYNPRDDKKEVEPDSNEEPNPDGKKEEHDFNYEEEEEDFHNEFADMEFEAKQIEEILYLHPSDHPGM